jgi:hypothetical protein
MAKEQCLPILPSKSSNSVALDTAFVPPVGRWRAAAEVAGAAWRALLIESRVGGVAQKCTHRQFLEYLHTALLAFLTKIASASNPNLPLPVFF